MLICVPWAFLRSYRKIFWLTDKLTMLPLDRAGVHKLFADQLAQDLARASILAVD